MKHGVHHPLRQRIQSGTEREAVAPAGRAGRGAGGGGRGRRRHHQRHGGPAAAAGLRAGDVITKISGPPAASPVQLQELSLSKKAGHTVDLEVCRSGQTASVTVTLGTQP